MERARSRVFVSCALNYRKRWILWLRILRRGALGTTCVRAGFRTKCARIECVPLITLHASVISMVHACLSTRFCCCWFLSHTHITAAAVTSDTTFGKQTQNPTKRPFRCFMLLASVPASSYRTCLFVKGTLITKLVRACVRACVLSYAMCELPFFIRSFLLLF